MSRYRSILQKDTEMCAICGSRKWLEWHHVFGASNRKNSEKHGLMVRLCHHCHNEPPGGIHHNAHANQQLRKMAQGKFEESNSRQLFMKIFGRNYL